MQKQRFVLAVVACFVVLSMVLGQGTMVLAGNTGALTGTVIDPTTKQPVAGAKVSVASPSQVATTTTDANGHFGFLSLAPDTYTVSAEKAGYSPVSLAGITVAADQSQNLQLTSQRELRTIGRTAARSSGNLVRSGVTSDVYNVSQAQQAAAAPLGGGNNLNSAYSAIQSTPGTLVPISDSPGWGQSIFIRGGDYTQTGNEVDGIPVNRQFDQYSGTPLSNIGTGEVQVYTGNQPVDAQANGLAGFVNQVIKTGTYPGSGGSDIGVGGPGYYHKFSVEYGGATSNRNFSYYLGFLGYNQQNRIVDQYNGARYTPLYGSPYNFVASGCGTAHPTAGCYQNAATAGLFGGGLPLAPNGYAVAPTYFGAVPSIADREGVANFHIAIPHPHDGLKDDVQFLYNTGETYNTPNDSFGDFGPAFGDVSNGTVTLANGSIIPNDANGICPSTSGMLPPVGTGPLACNGSTIPFYANQSVYTGPLYGALTQANLSQTRRLNFAGSNTNNANIIGGQVPFNQRDSETTGFAVEKVQFQHNFSSNAFARIYGYSAYSDRIDNGAVGLVQNYVGAFPADYLVSAHTRGIAALFDDQIDPHNLLQLDLGYNYTSSTRFNNTAGARSTVAYLVNAKNPTAACYSPTGALNPCNATAGQYRFDTSGVLAPRGQSPALNALGGLSCGGGPCEYLSVGSGAAGLLNNVNPAFTNAAIEDTIKPNDKLTLQAALRFEDFTYNLPNTNNPGNQLLVNDYNSNNCVSGTTVKSTLTVGGACPAGFTKAALSAVSPSREDYAHIFSPRFGLTYALDPNTVLRASYGRFTQSPQTSAVDATSVNPGIPSAQFFTNFGFASYARNVVPEISYNTDFSIEHALPRADMQFSVSPFYRKTTNEFVTILIDPKTNFVADVNGLNRTVTGAEFAVTKGNFGRPGFAAQLAYTYTYATAKFKVFPNGGSFVAQANAGVQQYNAYTKSCATNPNNPTCGKTVFCSATANANVAGCAGASGAAPCYAASGAPAPACGAGTVANPYWNSQSFGTFDPNASYFPYNNGIGNGANGIATSFLVPHVASLILQYKKGPWTFSPSFQFQGGSKYGSPLAAQGVAPDTCGVLAGASLAGDPRYTSGSPGPGQPYDASSCTSVIPIPNPQTKHFDGIGEYTQPNLFATNFSLNYDFNKTVGLNVIAANIFNRCFGGSKVPWGTGNIGCSYEQAGTGGQPYVGNSYNPGDFVQPYASQSYIPVLGGALQSVSSGSPLPFELFVNLNVHI